jgi:hypothetical protein
MMYKVLKAILLNKEQCLVADAVDAASPSLAELVDACVVVLLMGLQHL